MTSITTESGTLEAQGPPPARVKPFIEEVDPASRFADAAGKRVIYAVVAA